jgi:hypothetical protein
MAIRGARSKDSRCQNVSRQKCLPCPQSSPSPLEQLIPGGRKLKYNLTHDLDLVHVYASHFQYALETSDQCSITVYLIILLYYFTVIELYITYD